MLIAQLAISNDLAEAFNKGVETQLPKVIHYHKKHDNVEVADALQLVRNI